MWVLFAFSSALFAGITSILAKCGIKETDSDIASVIRTIVVLIFSWIMVFIAGSQYSLSTLSNRTWIFLILSGLCSGASWLCYFRALQCGDINKVVPIDKSSTVLTILLALILLKEPITLLKVCAVVLISLGTFLMIEKKSVEKEKSENGSSIILAVLSAFFASLTSILAKIGLDGVESNLGTAIRTSVILVMTLMIVFMKKKEKYVKNISRKELIFIILSGFATGSSWLCYYKALQDGLASIVVPIDKLSILVSILFSRIVFGEKLSTKSGTGLMIIVFGTLMMLI